MRTLTLAAALTLFPSSSFAIDPGARSHLEHLVHSGLGSPVAQDQTRVAQVVGVPGATAATKAGAAPRKISQNPRILAERQGYKRVSSLVDFPAFFPGIGVLFVKPDTLPTGPFLSFDRKDRLISTIYMLPLEQMNERKRFEAAAGFPGARVDHATMYFNGGHPGVDLPHYHYVLWHVSKKNEALVAR